MVFSKVNRVAHCPYSMYRQGLQSFTIINCSVANKDKFHRCKQSLEGTILHQFFLIFFMFYQGTCRTFSTDSTRMNKEVSLCIYNVKCTFMLFSNSIERAFISILIAFTVTFDIFNIRNSKEEKMKSNVIFDDFFPWMCEMNLLSSLLL